MSSHVAVRPRLSPLGREALLSASVAVGLGVALAWLGPPAGDLAGHAYLRMLFLRHGFTLWDNFWYAGRYSFVNYSVAYYPLAAAVGIKALAVASVGVAGSGFALVLGREWGRTARVASRVFAVVWSGVVLAGVYPFALGVAIALLALFSLQSGARRTFSVLAFLVLASSPLAFLILGLVLAGIALAHRPSLGRVRLPLLTMLTLAGAGAVIWRMFPAGGIYPFPVGEFLATVLFAGIGAVLTWRSGPARPLYFMFLVYLAACIGAFAVPTALGENIARMRFAAIPLAVLVLSLRHWRPRPVVPVVLLLAVPWNLSPFAVNMIQGIRDTSSRPAYWRPVIGFLRTHMSSAYRVEVVDTVDHWEAVYLPAAGIPIARGWYRQDDLPLNRTLYRHLDSRRYLAWLRHLGVRWVVLTEQPTDYSARSEARLVRSGRSGLTLAGTYRGIRIYSVPAARPIVTGPAPARVIALREAQITLQISRPGHYHVAFRYTPYWRTSNGCLTRSADGMLNLVAASPGVTELTFDLDPGPALDAVIGKSPRTCGSNAGRVGGSARPRAELP